MAARGGGGGPRGGGPRGGEAVWGEGRARAGMAEPVRWTRMYGCIYVYVCVNTCIYHQTSNFSNPSSKLDLRDLQQFTFKKCYCFMNWVNNWSGKVLRGRIGPKKQRKMC